MDPGRPTTYYPQPQSRHDRHARERERLSLSGGSAVNTARTYVTAARPDPLLKRAAGNDLFAQEQAALGGPNPYWLMAGVGLFLAAGAYTIGQYRS